jgi:hypothetical protein
MDWLRWHEFLSRLGRSTNRSRYIKPMTAQYFERMEAKLLDEAGMPYGARNAVLQLIKSERSRLEAARNGHRVIPYGTIRQVIMGICPRGPREKKSMHVSTTQIAAGLTIIADTSVLFTTRDWGVAGTLSTMAGGLAGVVTG